MRPIAAVWIVMLVAGCQSAPVAQTLHLFGLSRKPLVVALAAEKPRQTEPLAMLARTLNPFQPCEPLLAKLSQRLDRPATCDLAFTFQIEGHLQIGLAQLAMVTPRHYAAFSDPRRFEVLAVSRDERGRPARPAVLVVRRESSIRRVEDLAHKVVAFGPAGDPRTHLAALLLLNDHGLSKGDLALEPLPLPGSLKHFTNMRSVAQSVIRGSSDAGFVDLRSWERWAEEPADLPHPDRSRLRVVAETIALPDLLVLRSPKLDDPTAERVRSFLLSADRTASEALRPLDIAGFVAPDEATLDACLRLKKVVNAARGPAPAATHVLTSALR